MQSLFQEISSSKSKLFPVLSSLSTCLGDKIYNFVSYFWYQQYIVYLEYQKRTCRHIHSCLTKLAVSNTKLRFTVQRYIWNTHLTPDQNSSNWQSRQTICYGTQVGIEFLTEEAKKETVFSPAKDRGSEGRPKEHSWYPNRKQDQFRNKEISTVCIPESKLGLAHNAYETRSMSIISSHVCSLPTKCSLLLKESAHTQTGQAHFCEFHFCE